MKKYTLYTMLLGLAFSFNWSQANAQCPYGGNFWADLPVPNAGDVNFSYFWGGEYATVDVTIGNSYTFSTCGYAEFDTELTIYQEGTGTLVGYNDDGPGACGLSSEVTWTATFTGTVRVIVNEFGCGTNSSIAEISVTNNGAGSAAPANDDCVGATALTVNAGCVMTSTSSANATESMAGCAGTADDDVWFSFVANNTDMNVNVDGGTDFDAVLEVFSGSCGALVSLGCLDDTGADGSEAGVLSGLTVGQTYYVRVYHYFAGSSADGFDICVRGTPTGVVPANDNCSAAEVLTHQGAGSCFTSIGTTSGATASGPAGCVGTADDDVWYEFTATSPDAIIAVQGSASFDAVIELMGTDCTTSFACEDNTLSGDLETMSVTGLTVGTTYRVRVYHYSATAAADPTFEICITTPGVTTPCTAMTPICTDNGLNYQADANGLIEPGYSSTCGDAPVPGNDYGCLCSQPDPTWFYLEIDNSGDIIFDMAAAQDIDYALWGPFANLAAAQAACGSLAAPVDCSFSGSATETATITGAVTGQVYVLLITNYANVPQTITASQTGGTGSTNCSIVVPCAANAGGW